MLNTLCLKNEFRANVYNDKIYSDYTDKKHDYKLGNEYVSI